MPVFDIPVVKSTVNWASVEASTIEEAVREVKERIENQTITDLPLNEGLDEGYEYESFEEHYEGDTLVDSPAQAAFKEDMKKRMAKAN